jgi:cation diffusion facilitator CzcD-associated flavoprotein CzcO
LNPDWKAFYALQPEIHAYWEGIFRKHNLDSHFVPDTKVTYARWDNGLQAYELTLENVKTGIVSHAVTEILVSAIGGFMTPDIPKDIGDTSVFKGDLWHSAKWRHDVSLSGKRVAVVGNGCSRSVSHYFPLLAGLMVQIQCAAYTGDCKGSQYSRS